ncbi:MAG: tetratricopeptide repeat protein [Caldilineaceae bacterium]
MKIEHPFQELFWHYMDLNNFTQTALALRLEYTDGSTVSAWVTGRTRYPGGALEKTCDAFKISGSKRQEFVEAYSAFWHWKHLQKRGDSQNISSPSLEPDVIDTSCAGENIDVPLSIPLDRPPRVPHFTLRSTSGSDHEIANLLEALAAERIITLTGPGGIGKTAIVIEAVWKLAPDNTPPVDYPDGIIWCDLYRQRSAVDTLKEIAVRFDEPWEPGAEWYAAHRALMNRHVLLILDSADQMDDLNSIIDAIGPHCQVIITTTQKLDIEGREIVVHVLPPKISEAVLSAWSGLPVADKHVKQICKLTGYLPLALRIAGQRIATGVMTAEECYQRLAESDLTTLHVSERKHKSIPILLDMGIQPLSREARNVLAVMGMLAYAPIESEILTQALAVSPLDLSKLLSELIDYCLISPDKAQIQFIHRLIHTHVQQSDAPDSAVQRLSVHLTDLVQQLQSQEPPGYARLDQLRPHVMAVLARGHQLQNWNTVSPLILAIDPYLEAQGHWTQQITALEYGVAAAQAQHEVQQEGEFVGRLGAVYNELGKFDQAISLYEQALKISQQLSDRRSESGNLSDLGNAYSDLGQMERAVEYYQQALTISREVEDLKGRALSQAIWVSHYLLGRIDQAIPLYQRAMKLVGSLVITKLRVLMLATWVVYTKIRGMSKMP